MDFHEVANIFPMLTGAEYQALKDDIAANGQLEAIWTYQGKVLDGRNRYAACLDLAIEPKYRKYTGDDPLQFVLSMNLHRRHLNETQRAIVASKIANMQVGGDRRSDHSANLQNDKVSVSTAAKMMSVSERTVASVKAIERDAPELLPQMEAGTMRVSQAIQQIRRQEVTQQLESVEVQEAKAIEGVYDVIVIDPPWPIQKIERDVAPNQVAFEYPTMTIDELLTLDVPAADNCHVWLWTTQKFLPSALWLLEMWEMKYVCTFVWHKPGGFQPFGLPQYNCEFVLYARKGSPQFIDFKDFMTCFNAPRGEHSEKPEAFYNTVRRVTAGRRLDMFSRRQIEGFDGWGKEAVE